MMYEVLDLFSGIGGFSLGLERTGGFKTVAFCEIDPFCQAVLKKHWPEVPCYDDITTLTAERLAADGIRPDVLCGGFPCQDISVAGKGAGLEGERSGLWREYARLIGEIRPCFAIVENVAALLGRGLGRVLGDLAALGFDAEWHCIPACAVGALTYAIASGLLPTIGKNEGKGSSKKRWKGSPHFRGAKMSEGLRTGPNDPIYTNPDFATAAMGFPKNWVRLETRSIQKSRKSSAKQS